MLRKVPTQSHLIPISMHVKDINNTTRTQKSCALSVKMSHQNQCMKKPPSISTRRSRSVPRIFGPATSCIAQCWRLDSTRGKISRTMFDTTLQQSNIIRRIQGQDEPIGQNSKGIAFTELLAYNGEAKLYEVKVPVFILASLVNIQSMLLSSY